MTTHEVAQYDGAVATVTYYHQRKHSGRFVSELTEITGRVKLVEISATNIYVHIEDPETGRSLLGMPAAYVRGIK